MIQIFKYKFITHLFFGVLATFSAVELLNNGLLFNPNNSIKADDKHVLFIAGAPSHGFGNHEHYGGSQLLASTIEEADVGLKTTVVNGWPSDASIFDDVHSVVIYSNGGPGHPIMDHLESFHEVMERGVGFVTLHYAVEVPKGEAGNKFIEWQGGYFETDWSVNPFWTADFNEFSTHPIQRGVESFSIHDEWYYHMRFADQMEGVTPVLTDLPPAESLDRNDGPHSNNPHVRESVLQNEEHQHVAWAFERTNGGRSFGFTGGHYHWNWGHDQFRRIVANAIVWSAGAEVPQDGLQFSPITALELAELTDDTIPDDWDHQDIQDMLDKANN